MSTLPNAADIPGLQDALARYAIGKRPYVQAEYDKFISYLQTEFANLTEANNFVISGDYLQLDLSFVLVSSRTLETVKLICTKLKDTLIQKGYYAEIQPYDIPGNPDLGIPKTIGIAYTINAAPPIVFY